MQIKTLTTKTKHTPLRISVAALAVLLVCCAAFAGAASAAWDGTADTTWYTGHETDPSYTINTAEQLAGLAELVNDNTNPVNFTGKTIKLGANLDLTCSEKTWTPIGNSEAHAFRGTFDGQGHTISNMVVTAKSGNFYGLFGRAGSGSVLKNVGMVDAMLSGGDLVGSLVGSHAGTGDIINCNATGTKGSISKTGSLVGGLIGEMGLEFVFSSKMNLIIPAGNIKNCYATVPVSGGSNIGGLVGRTSGNIMNSYATGNVEGAHDPRSMGAIVGGLAGDVGGNITNCYATGSVIGGNYVGGLVASVSGNITNCYAIGSVTGVGDTGMVGGLVGKLSNSINNSIALNKKVSGTTAVGRVGVNSTYKSDKPTYANIYAQENMTLVGTGGIDGTSASKNQTWNNETFYRKVFSNFDTDWVMASGDKYKLPILKGAIVPNFDARYLDPTAPAKPDNYILVNDKEISGNLHKDEITGGYYAYEGGSVEIPLYLTGNATHKSLGAFDVQVNVTTESATEPLYTSSTIKFTTPLLSKWDCTYYQNHVAGAMAGGNPVSLAKDAEETFLIVNLTGVQNSSKDGVYTVYVRPDGVHSAEKGDTSMFSEVTDHNNMTIDDFDVRLFNAENDEDGKVIEIAVIGKPQLLKVVVDAYDEEVSKDGWINLYWERENATGIDSPIIATFDSAIGNATGIAWTIDSKSSLKPYMKEFGESTPTVYSIKNSIKTNESAQMGEKDLKYGSVDVSFNIDGATVSGEFTIQISNWLQNQTWGNSFNTIGQNLSWVLKVNSGPVNTNESVLGWKTYANFTDVQNYTGLEIPVREVIYDIGGEAGRLDKKHYTILNEKGNESIMIGSGIYIKNCTFSSRMNPYTITITFNGHALGDATMNGFINIADSTAMGVDILRGGALFNNTVNKFFADVNEVKDGKITAVDVQRLNKYLVD